MKQSIVLAWRPVATLALLALLLGSSAVMLAPSVSAQEQEASTSTTLVSSSDSSSDVLKVSDIETKATPIVMEASAATALGTSNTQVERYHVTSLLYIDGKPATADSAHRAEFPMSYTYRANNMGSGTANYNLGTSSRTPYQYQSADYDAGSNYVTNEVLGGTVVGATCRTANRFQLLGYSSGPTLAEAEAKTPSLTAPAFNGLASHQYLIVWNKLCSPTSGQLDGTVSGGRDTTNGSLAVNSITTVSGNATADGTFQNGWQYVFHLTVPKDEPHLMMKFANWLSTNGAHQVAVANNLRISSAQANNGGATILLTAADTYSSPALNLTSDLNASLAGLQVEVKVEMAIPADSFNGAYTTSYGIKTQ